MHIEISEGIDSILIVEDEGLVSLMMESLALDMGVHNVHVVADLEHALEIAATEDLDCAVLDLQVRGGDSTRVADILAARGIPFMFSTSGYADALPPQHRHRPLVTKPFAEDDFKLLLLDTWCLARHAIAPVAEQRVATLGPTD